MTAFAAFERSMFETFRPGFNVSHKHPRLAFWAARAAKGQ
jgi:hypothetical protein